MTERERESEKDPRLASILVTVSLKFHSGLISWGDPGVMWSRDGGVEATEPVTSLTNQCVPVLAVCPSGGPGGTKAIDMIHIGLCWKEFMRQRLY